MYLLYKTFLFHTCWSGAVCIHSISLCLPLLIPFLFSDYYSVSFHVGVHVCVYTLFCVNVMRGTPQYWCGGWRASGNWFSLSLMWVPGIKLKLSGLATGTFSDSAISLDMVHVLLVLIPNKTFCLGWMVMGREVLRTWYIFKFKSLLIFYKWLLLLTILFTFCFI